MDVHFKICNLCNLKYSTIYNHVCSQDENEYIYCKICDMYLFSHEFKDHIYSHSLEPGRNNIEEAKEESKIIEEDYDIIQRTEMQQVRDNSIEESKVNSESCAANNNNNVATSSSSGGGLFNAVRNFPYDKLRVYNTNFSIGSLIENTLLNSNLSI